MSVVRATNLILPDTTWDSQWLAARRGARPLIWRRITPWAATGSLVLADIWVFLISFIMASAARDALVGPMEQPLLLWVVGAAWLVARAGVGLYPGYGMAPPEELRASVVTTLGVALVEIAAFFVLKEEAASRLVAITTWGLVLLLSLMVRGPLKALLVRLQLYGCPVVVVGAGKRGAFVVREMKANPAMGYIPVAVFDDDLAKIGRTIEGVPVLGTVEDAPLTVFPYPVRHALIAVSAAPRARLLDIARALTRRYAHLVVMPDVLGLADLWVRPRALGTSLSLEVRNNLLRPVNGIVKRCADVLFGLPLLAAAAPAIVTAAVAIKLISPGPAFFGQEREGRNGRRIRVWKLRTMVPDAERRLAEYLAANPEARREWETRMKLFNDPRVIPYVGKWLRRFSIDEFPQFWNIVKGDMSLVGPRPFPDYHLAKFDDEFRAFRHQVRPGLTGMWQVNERSTADMAGQELRDSYYIRNWSLWLDLWILFRTLPAALRGTGAC
jgi:Undecaprenyl-phosphate galactose phosphotransferase WbaP